MNSLDLNPDPKDDDLPIGSSRRRGFTRASPDALATMPARPRTVDGCGSKRWADASLEVPLVASSAIPHRRSSGSAQLVLWSVVDERKLNEKWCDAGAIRHREDGCVRSRSELESSSLWTRRR